MKKLFSILLVLPIITVAQNSKRPLHYVSLGISIGKSDIKNDITKPEKNNFIENFELQYHYSNFLIGYEVFKTGLKDKTYPDGLPGLLTRINTRHIVTTNNFYAGVHWPDIFRKKAPSLDVILGVGNLTYDKPIVGRSDSWAGFFNGPYIKDHQISKKAVYMIGSRLYLTPSTERFQIHLAYRKYYCEIVSFSVVQAGAAWAIHLNKKKNQTNRQN